MNAYCQIEHVDSDGDTGTPCSNRAVAECADCGAAVPTVVHGAVGSHSVRYAVITTRQIPA
jgi:hypothetical protein